MIGCDVSGRVRHSSQNTNDPHATVT